jgi:hypothetical protein
VRQVPRPHRLHREQAPTARGLADLGGLGGVEGHGLLDEDVLARLEREDRLVAVVAVRDAT